MGAETAIRWTDSTWNFFTGCTQISAGCDHCYALTIAEKYRGLASFPVGFDPMVRPHKMRDPAKWKTPRQVFVNSMSDIFHPAFIDARDEAGELYLDRAFDLMLDVDRHIYQVLTKRPKRMRDYLVGGNDIAWKLPPVGSGRPTLWRDGYLARRGLTEVPEHIWIGSTIESDLFTFRADVLREIPAVNRMISAEPLLGPLPSLDLTGITWLIVGGESGPGFRPMDHEWARQLRDAAHEAGTPFYFKQSSGYRTELGQLLDGERWEERPTLRRDAVLL